MFEIHIVESLRVNRYAKCFRFTSSVTAAIKKKTNEWFLFQHVEKKGEGRWMRKKRKASLWFKFHHKADVSTASGSPKPFPMHSCILWTRKIDSFLCVSKVKEVGIYRNLSFAELSAYPRQVSAKFRYRYSNCVYLVLRV